MFSLESPHRGDSNVYTQYTIFNVKSKITLIYPKSVAMGFRCKGLKNEFEIAVVNEPSVFEPLKFCCSQDSKNNELSEEPATDGGLHTCSQNRQSTKFQNHENINFV